MDPTSDSCLPQPGPAASAGEAVTTIHMGRAIAGDAASIAWLVDRFSPFLLAQASWRMGPHLRRHCDPEDLVAEAWMCLLPKLPEMPPRDGRYTPVVLRFLATTILYRVNALLKKHLRNSTGEAGPVLREPTSGAIGDAVRTLARAEALDQLTQALASLSPEEHQIIILRGIEQHPNHLVAELLSLSPSATAMRYQRALRRLRGLLPSTILDDLPEDT